MGRLVATQDEANGAHTVTVRATARFKPEGERASWPDAVPSDAEPDRWGYVETDPLPVCTLHDCSEIEAGLVVHWCDALNDADSGFSGYRDNATKTISLLDRLHGVRFPDPSDDGMGPCAPFLPRQYRRRGLRGRVCHRRRTNRLRSSRGARRTFAP